MDRIIRAIAADNYIKMSVIDAKDTVLVDRCLSYADA